MNEVGSESEPLTPRTPIEEIVAETWTGLLKIPVRDVTQNFFGLGGHSLQAIEILCQLRRKFSVGLSINDFFTKPTVAQQAALVSERLACDASHGEISRFNATRPGTALRRCRGSRGARSRSASKAGYSVARTE